MGWRVCGNREQVRARLERAWAVTSAITSSGSEGEVSNRAFIGGPASVNSPLSGTAQGNALGIRIHILEP
jgi:hypothetical protein